MKAEVENSERLLQSASGLRRIFAEMKQACSEEVQKAEQLHRETEQELAHSRQMLQRARQAEQAAQVALRAAQAAVAAASAEVAAATGSLNPAAMAAAMAHLRQAKRAYDAAKRAYEAAKMHREHMEKRVTLAEKAEQLARVMREKLLAMCRMHVMKALHVVQEVAARLVVAQQKLAGYHASVVPQATLEALTSELSGTFESAEKPWDVASSTASEPDAADDAAAPDDSAVSGAQDVLKASKTTKASEAFEVWAQYELQDTGKPVPFSELHDRFNASDDVRQGLLQHLYETDAKFRQQVDEIRAQAATDPEGAALRVRKGLAGRLGEEMVRYALQPYGTSCETQVHHDVADGGFTKTDFVLHGLKAPIILGRGKGMGATVGQDIAIEVKTGSEGYIAHEKEHILRQVEGHQPYDASWVICSRDIKDMTEGRQAQYREEIREAGSPVLGLLPEKAELDQSCWDFIRSA